MRPDFKNIHPKYTQNTIVFRTENVPNTPSYTNKQHSNKQFLNKQYSKLQQKLPIVSTCKLPNLEFGLKFWHQILPIYLNDDFNKFAFNLVSKFPLKFEKFQNFGNL